MNTFFKKTGALIQHPGTLLSLLTVMLLVYATCAQADTGTDYLSGMSSGAVSTFGEGSTFEKLLYLGEAVVMGFTWVKTKSVWALAGLPVLMIATHFFFKYAMQ